VFKSDADRFCRRDFAHWTSGVQLSEPLQFNIASGINGLTYALIRRPFDQADDGCKQRAADGRCAGVPGNFAACAGLSNHRLQNAQQRRQLAAADPADDSQNRPQNRAQVRILQERADNIAARGTADYLDQQWDKLFHTEALVREETNGKIPTSASPPGNRNIKLA
jgi:hypothetical protein